MGKFRHFIGQERLLETGATADLQLLLRLPPPPPLQPRPDLLLTEGEEEGGSSPLLLDEADSSEPLDYSMKGPRSQPPNAAGDVVLHKLRHAVMQRQPRSPESPQLPLEALKMVLMHHHQQQQQQQQQHQRRPQQPPQSVVVDSDTESKAAYAADCIKSRLEGCGKRVHLFLGILLHFGMPPGQTGEAIFDRVISFSDEHKNLRDQPTPHFMVLDSKLLALIWCKFKGNSSNEYSTLTRAIRSTRQKYRGIFESVENPGKKLYKFGPVALDQFRQLFPGSYSQAGKREAA